MTGAYAISGDGALAISVAGYTKISSNANSGAALSLNSGAKYSQAYSSGQLALYDIIQDTTPQLGGDLDANSFAIHNATGISGTNISGGSIFSDQYMGPNGVVPFYSGSTKIAEFNILVDTKRLTGGGGSFYISPNATNTYPRIRLTDDSLMELDCKAGTSVTFNEEQAEMFKMTLDPSVQSNLYGGSNASDVMKIQANSSDSTPYILLSGSTGRIGINKMDPQSVLHVIGDISSSTGLDTGWLSGTALHVATVSCSTYHGPSTGGGLSAVVDDTSPQLGGDLDGNSKAIYGATGISGAVFSGGRFRGADAYFDMIYPNSLGDTDTYIDMDNNTMKIVAANQNYMQLGSARALFNLGRNDIDFEVRGNNDYSLFFVNAGTDRVGVYTTTPQYKFDVSGSIHAKYGISGADISGGSLKVGTTRIDDILDEDDMASNSATGLATQQSIKKYVDDNAAGVPGATISSNFFVVGSGNTLWDWYTASSSKLTTISGSLSDRINAIGGLDGATISSNFFLIGSGNTLWSWMDNSGAKYTNIYESGSSYSLDHAWYDASSSRISEYVASGDEYSSAYSWFDASASQISDFVASGDEYSTNYSWYNDNNTQLDNLLASGTKYTQAYISASTGVFALAGAAPAAHKDTHDPEDGSDPLDAAAAGEIVGVAAAAEGSAHSLARSDHTHQIQHSIADNHIITIDDTDAADNDYAKFTADGLEGRDYSEVRSDLELQELLDSGTKYTQAYQSGQIATYANQHVTFGSVSSQAGISGNWQAPLFASLTAAGDAVDRPGQIIRTSGNTHGTWVWISIYGGSSYDWMQLTYLAGN
jgi:hypothetical protein